VFVPYAVRHLGLSAAGVGVTLGMYGVGMVVGALAATRVMARLAFGTVIGLVAETAVLAVCRPALWAWPILVLILLRCRLRAPVYPHRPSRAWSWSVAAVALAFVGYLTAAFLRANAPVPAKGPQWYMIDQLNLLAITGDLAHHFPLAVPELGGEGLGYHWFAYAHLAAAANLSGVDLPVLWFRLDLPALAATAVVALAVAAVGIYRWQESQRLAEVVEIDSQLLTDDLPIDAYLDRGFQNWLKKRAADE